MRKLALACAAIALTSRATDAQAFECTRISETGVTQVWLSRCIPYAISCSNDLLLGTEMRATIARSFSRWGDVGCSDMSFVEIGYVPELENFEVAKARAQRNVIGAIDSDNDLEIFPDTRLLALTFTHFALDTGEILDADIMLNAARFTFADTETGCSDEDTFDLENTLVHEIGHLIGFDHVNGPEATMFASAEACEIKKRDLDQDDMDAICTVYPTGAAANTCSAPQQGYDNAGVDGELFRAQCERFTGGTDVKTEAQCIEDRAAAGCSCRTNGLTRAPGWFGLLSLLLLVVLRPGVKRRASGR